MVQSRFQLIIRSLFVKRKEFKKKNSGALLRGQRNRRALSKTMLQMKITFFNFHADRNNFLPNRTSFIERTKFLQVNGLFRSAQDLRRCWMSGGQRAAFLSFIIAVRRRRFGRHWFGFRRFECRRREAESSTVARGRAWH